MLKKEYITPEMEEFEMRYQLPLCVSGNDNDDDDPMGGETPTYDPNKPFG